MSGDDDDPQERSANAGEYVLGTLDAAEREAFERSLATDAALRAEVYAWQDRLLGLSRRVQEQEPKPDLWLDIESRLQQQPAPPAAATAANDPLWQRLRRWQLGSGLAVAAALLLAVLLLLRGMLPQPNAERYLAVLQAPDKTAGWVVEAAVGGSLRLVPVGAADAVPEGKSLQFWTKREGDAGPTSLGLVRPGQAVEVPAGKLPGIEARQLFELTLEPAAGSPIGRPTGPILYVGRTVKL